MLRDYSVRFGLHVPPVEKLYSEPFEEMTERIENEMAINFIQWWKYKMKELEKDHLGSLLFDERRITLRKSLRCPSYTKVEVRTGVPSVQKAEEYVVRVG